MGYFTRIKTDRYLQIWPDCRRYFPALSLLLLSSVTLAQPGSLDTDFNGSGALYDTYNPNDHASRRNQAILPIINPDGSFQMLGITSDSSSSLALTNFSANGQREEVILIPGPTGTAAALTADNKLIVGRQSAICCRYQLTWLSETFYARWGAGCQLCLRWHVCRQQFIVSGVGIQYCHRCREPDPGDVILKWADPLYA